LEPETPFLTAIVSSQKNIVDSMFLLKLSKLGIKLIII
jgi:hypothetical protein